MRSTGVYTGTTHSCVVIKYMLSKHYLYPDLYMYIQCVFGYHWHVRYFSSDLYFWCLPSSFVRLINLRFKCEHLAFIFSVFFDPDFRLLGSRWPIYQ
jgi:hypothetical protein